MVKIACLSINPILISLLFIVSTPSWAKTITIGAFTAHQTCQAYQSFRKQTNPGTIKLSLDKQYPIIEQNKATNPQWYRIYLMEASPKKRWVSAQCGKALLTQETPPEENQNTCRTAGDADSYILALSWQPAFCEKHRHKPECSVHDPKAYQASNFTLHGLWPNKASCGTQYGFCGQYRKSKRPFSKYPPVPISQFTLQQLSIVMPSAAHQSYLQRHEWYKHGVCQTSWDADSYFLTAMRLLQTFNSGEIYHFISRNIGNTVTTQAFFKAVDQTLGVGAHQRLQLSCRKHMLVDIYIHLPQTWPKNTPLKTLIQQAAPKFKSNCGKSFVIDPIGF